MVLAGAEIGERSVVADQAHVRERTAIGAETVVGRGGPVENDVQIGDRVRMQTGAYVTAWSVVEDDVFIAPGVMLTNDPTAGRRPEGVAAPARPEARLPERRRAVLVPGIEVGAEAFVGAGAVVTRDVAPGAVVMGVPARPVRDVPAR